MFTDFLSQRHKEGTKCTKFFGTRMTRITRIYADFNFGFGSAKAEADDDGFSLRLKTATEN